MLDSLFLFWYCSIKWLTSWSISIRSCTIFSLSKGSLFIWMRIQWPVLRAGTSSSSGGSETRVQRSKYRDAGTETQVPRPNFSSRLYQKFVLTIIYYIQPQLKCNKKDKRNFLQFCYIQTNFHRSYICMITVRIQWVYWSLFYMYSKNPYTLYILILIRLQ